MFVHERRAVKVEPLAEFSAAAKGAGRWLVRDLLPAESIVVLFGPPKSGKSFLLFDLLASAAAGRPWFGHDVSRGVRSVVVVGEGIRGARVRCRALADTYGEGIPFSIVVGPFPIVERSEELIAALREYRPDVVAFDVMSAFFVGDENATQAMAEFLAALRIIRDALCCTIVLVHHSGIAAQNRERGSSVLRGAVDVTVRVGRTQAGLLAYRVVASRDSEAWADSRLLRLEPVTTDIVDIDGQPITTCRVVPAAGVAASGQLLTARQQEVHDVAVKLAQARRNGSSKVTLAKSAVVAAVVANGGNRPATYRHLDLVAERCGWRTVDHQVEVHLL